MINLTEFLDQIKVIAENFGFETKITDDREKTYISLDGLPVGFYPMRIIADVLHTENRVFLWGYVRTTSWTFEGERTDIHDAVSVIWAVFLRILRNISSSLWIVPHPAVDISGEIYGRYVLFEQPFTLGLPLSEDTIEQISHVLSATFYFVHTFWQMVDWPFCNCEACGPRETPPFFWSWEKGKIWAREIAEITNEDVDQDGVQYSVRYHPSWKYYRSVNTNISLWHMPEVAKAIGHAIDHKEPWQVINGINGFLFTSQQTQNFVTYKNERWVRKILKSLDGENPEQAPYTIPLENHFVVIGQNHILSFQRDCGRKRFEDERERIRRRHLKEAQILFPVNSFEWIEYVDGDDFERLILELLKREPDIKWVKQVSGTNEPDGGRDLIAEWQTPPLFGQYLNEDQNPFYTRRIVVQCKVRKKGVGKSDVKDIRDTIEHYDASGYFLAVSTHLTRELTEQLEKIRYGGRYWVDWWGRTEIEERLKLYPDIAHQFPAILQIRT